MSLLRDLGPDINNFKKKRNFGVVLENFKV